MKFLSESGQIVYGDITQASEVTAILTIDDVYEFNFSFGSSCCTLPCLGKAYSEQDAMTTLKWIAQAIKACKEGRLECTKNTKSDSTEQDSK